MADIEDQFSAMARSSTANWLPDVILAFRDARGTAEFRQVYRWIERNRKVLPEAWKETVRATVYHHSSDSPAFTKGNPDVFFKKGRGLWALRHPAEALSGKKDLNLRTDVILSLTKEQLESLVGKTTDELLAYINQQVEEKKRKFKIE
jgi:hypothetical protein